MTPQFQQLSKLYLEAPLCRECRFRYANGELRDNKGSLIKWCKKLAFGSDVRDGLRCQFFRKEI